jgi:hypothetical protein
MPGKASVIVGCRRRREGYNPLMLMNAWLYPRIVFGLFGLRLSDVNWICLYNGPMLRDIRLTQSGIPMLTEILVRLRDRGATFLEVDVEDDRACVGRPLRGALAGDVQHIAGIAAALEQVAI